MTQEDLQRLGELLIEEGALNQEDVARAISDAGMKGTPVGSLLDKTHHVRRADLAGFLAADFVIPKIEDLRKIDLYEEAVRLVPEALARKHELLPFVKVGDILCIARPNYFNRVGLADIRKQTGLKLKIFQADEDQVLAALDRVYKGSRAELPAPKAGAKMETTVVRATPPAVKEEEFEGVPLISMESEFAAAPARPAAARAEPQLEEIAEIEAPAKPGVREILTPQPVSAQEYEMAERAGYARVLREFEELCDASRPMSPLRMS